MTDRLTRPLPYGQTVKRLTAAGAFALTLGLAAGCHKPAAKPEASPAAAQNGAAPVETADVTVGEVVRWTPVTGSLVSLQDVSLSSKIGGRLAEVLVREGDTVSVGQIVARVDMTDQEAQQRSALGAVEAARAKLAQAEAAYKQQLTSSHSAVQAAQAALDQQKVNTKTGVQSAQAGVEAARAQLSQVREGSRSQDVRRAQTQVAIAQANLNKANSDLRRYQQLAKEGAVSQSTLEQYETSAQVSAESLRAAQEALSLVKEGSRSQEITQAEQNLRQAEERLRQAKASSSLDEVRRADLVQARAALAQNDVRRADILAARAALQQAQSSLAIANKALSDAYVRSPIVGQVATRTAEPGQVVGAGSPILRIVGLGSIYFEPKVPDRDMGYVKVGQPAEISVNAFPGRTFGGTVTKIYPAAAENNRAFPVRITLNSSGVALRPEMYAQGRIRSEVHRNAVQVPQTALLRNESSATDTSARVFTVKDGVAHERKVRIGLSSADGSRVEVSGIEAGETVVVSGQRALADGASVSAKPAPAMQVSASQPK